MVGAQIDIRHIGLCRQGGANTVVKKERHINGVQLAVIVTN